MNRRSSCGSAMSLHGCVYCDKRFRDEKALKTLSDENVSNPVTYLILLHKTIAINCTLLDYMVAILMSQ